MRKKFKYLTHLTDLQSVYESLMDKINFKLTKKLAEEKNFVAENLGLGVACRFYKDRHRRRRTGYSERSGFNHSKI